jgi:DivIVA domain-containing protein
VDDLSVEDIRNREFSPARRGYDRTEVDEFRDVVADRVASLSAELDGLRSRLEQVGLTDPQDLKQEFDAIGADIQEVLQAARRTAEEMRSRAGDDAARWRSEADRDSRDLRAEADAAAIALRTAAWETGTELLEQAQESASHIIATAEQDALFIRAEAEREALRMTAEARRLGEEERRSARGEAERLLMGARDESESVLAAARQSAEAAQERARALEARRSELMKELEAARESIGQMEQEIDSRREALSMAAVSDATGMRVITGEEAHGEWSDDDTGVRLVPVARFETAEPVDADAMADEVRKLREALTAPTTPIEEGPAASEVTAAGAVDAAELAAAEAAEPAAVEGGEPAAAEAAESPPYEAAGGVVVESAAAAEPTAEFGEPSPPTPAAPPPPPRPALSPDRSIHAEAEAPAESDLDDEAAPLPSTPQEAAPASEHQDPLSDLFASLRTRPEETPAAESPPEPPPAEAEPAPVDTAADAWEPAAEAEPEPPGPEVAVTDPFELRDRLLLPIQNRALRSVKRRLVDLQNRVLEELRVDGDGWAPQASMFRAAIADELTPVRQEAFVAGFAAAAELLGRADAPSPSGAPPPDDAPDFVAGLVTAVGEALAKARAGASGAREVASAVSKVFRAWRTDEAERRVRWMARAAYHRGVAGGLAALGVPLITAVAPSRPCGECPAGTGRSWDPATEPPDDLPMPPASSECSASIVPAAVP